MSRCLTDEMSASEPLTGETANERRPEFVALVRARAANSPEREIYVDYRLTDATAAGFAAYRPTRVTAEDFWTRVTELAAGFRALGVSAGARVAVQLPNRHEFAEIHLALYALGAVTMPVSTIYRSRDLGRMLRLAGAVGLVVPSQYGSFDYQQMARDLKQKTDSLAFVVAVGDGMVHHEVHSYADVALAGSKDSATIEAVSRGTWIPSPDEPMLLNFTSGTTGDPKGVIHSFRSVASAVVATIERLQLAEDDVSLVAPTMGHAAGFLNGIYMAYFIGHRVVCVDQWDAAMALRVLAAERATYAPVMPPYLVDLLAQPDFDSFDLSTWRTARVSGGPIPRAALEELSRKQPQLRLCPGWGMSEALYVTCAGPDDDRVERQEADGRAVGTCQIEIRDTDDETRVLGIGEIGQIFVRAPSMMIGYFDRPDLTDACFTPDGWYRTGDLGNLRPGGHLSIQGRIRDLVVRGGENVPILDVEFLLTEHPAIATAVIVGVPDHRLGERVCAVVTTTPGVQSPTLEGLRTYLDDRGLTRQFIPEYLIVTDRFPTTTTGKIMKSVVKETALARLTTESDPTTKENFR